MKQRTITSLDNSDMEPVVNKILKKEKYISGPALIALCLKELNVKVDDYELWDKQLTEYISYRIFKDGSIGLRKVK